MFICASGGSLSSNLVRHFSVRCTQLSKVGRGPTDLGPVIFHYPSRANFAAIFAVSLWVFREDSPLSMPTSRVFSWTQCGGLQIRPEKRRLTVAVPQRRESIGIGN